MGTSKSLGKKEANEKFYTHPRVAAECLSHLRLSEYGTIIEPAAGNGSFSKQIKNCLAYDIAPEDDSILQKDFFEFEPSNFTKPLLVITNPPFTLAISFFNKAATFADTIAMILPRSFKKDSVQNKLNLNFHLQSQFDLEANAFLLHDSPYDVNACFQIWSRELKPRKKKSSITTSDLFTFTDSQGAECSIRRVGGNAGKASINTNYAAASNYFIKRNPEYFPSIQDFIDTVNSLQIESIRDTVKVPSLSKTELITALEMEVF